MILIALGSNLPGPFGAPERNLSEALCRLQKRGIAVHQASSFYKTRPEPDTGQPWYANAIAEIVTSRTPPQLLKDMHLIEAEFGRVRTVRNADRALDLDLIAYHDCVLETPGGLIVPHPRAHERIFVLEPLCEIAPGWIHPLLRKTARELLTDVQENQAAA